MSFSLFNRMHPVAAAMTGAVLTVAMVLISFVALEPAVTQGATDTFIVQQTITGEISFTTTATDVSMAPDIAGITGGYSSGTTTVAVATNNPNGYTLTLAFASSTAMIHANGVNEIPNYGSGSVTRLFSVATGEAGFAFTASSTNVVSALLDSGAACGSGSPSNDTCWIMPSDATSGYTLVDRSSATDAAGEETEITFRVGVGANPSPALPLGLYTATATLTATEK